MNPGYNAHLEDGSTFAAADVEFSNLRADLVSPSWLGWSHSRVERELTARAREVVRRLLQAHVTLRAQAEPVGAIVGADGRKRTHIRPARGRQLETTFGPIAVARTGFSGRDAGSLFPVDASLNLPSHRFSHEVERLVARTAAKLSYEETTALIEETTGADVAKRQVESITRRAAVDFHAFYEARKWTKESQKGTGPFLILSFDQKGIVVQTSELRGRTLKIAMNRVPRLRAVHNRDGKKHWRGKKRMAMVAAVHTISPDHRTPEDVVRGLRRLQDVVNRNHRTVRPELKRVWASLEQEPFGVVEEAFDDALKRDPTQAKHWLVLIDGDPDLRKWVLQAAKARGVRVTLVLDIIHVLQYLWGAGRDLRGATDDTIEHWVLQRLTRVLNGQVSDVVAGMNRAATKLRLKPNQRKGVDKCAEYCLKRKDMMEYGPLLAAGAPIATGVIEGTCKHLIASRCDKSGARWSVDGADAVLRLRAIHLSGDFDEYWSFHEAQEMVRNHASRYAGNVIPALEPIGRGRNVIRLGATGHRRSNCATPRAA